MGEGVARSEERRVRGAGGAHGRVGDLEERSLGRQGVDAGRGGAPVAVGAQVIGAQRVDGEQQHVGPVGGAAATGDQRQQRS